MSTSEFTKSAASWQDGKLRVVINDEEQYSIWPAQRDIPLGWRDCGIAGSKDECLGYIASAWIDLRPLSVRRAMEPPDERPGVAGLADNL